MAEVITNSSVKPMVNKEQKMAETTVEYGRLRDMLLNDINRDTDKILATLESKKGNAMDMSAFMAGQNSNRGLDAAMMMNGGMGNMWNNPLN